MASPLAFAESGLAVAVERLLDAVLVADDERRYIHANPAACALLGLPREELLKRRIEDFVEPQFRVAVMEQWAAFLQSGVQAGPFRLVRPDGAIRDVEFSAVANVQPHAHVSFLRDVTQQKLAEKALQDQTRELARSNAELQRFAFLASHDLKEPLRIVTIFSQLLAAKYGTEMNDTMRGYVEAIENGATRMADMIDGLLSYTRASMQRDTIMEDADVNRLLDQAVSQLAISIQQKNAVIVREQLPRVRCAPLEIVQVFQNLLGNAIKYSERVPEIHVECERGVKEWLFRVRDNGIGIAPEHHDKVFGIFTRLHSSEYAGTGIGLAICKAIVDRHGGTIGVESQPGEGATFWFTLPDMNGPVATAAG